MQLADRIIPMVVKSGAAGSMKSLHQFIFDKKLTFAVRVDRNPPSLMHLSVRTTQGDQVAYQLLSLPPYLLGNLRATIESCPQ